MLQELLKEIRINNLSVVLDKRDLKVRSDHAHVPVELIQKIKANKADLIRYLEDIHAPGVNNIEAVAGEESYPLSSSQHRLWILSQLDDAKRAYNMPRVYLFAGALDLSGLTRAFFALIARHESLRTVFKQNEHGEARQYILRPGMEGFKISVQDLRGQSEAKLANLLRNDAEDGFDLENGPLMRAGLYQVQDQEWIFTCTLHHIVSDGWSMDIMIRELLHFYKEDSLAGSQPLVPLRIHYKDYAVWQQAQLSDTDIAGHKAYWLNQFSGEIPVLELPGDRVRPAVKTYRGGMVEKILHGPMIDSLRDLCREEGCTLFMGLLASVNALLYRYTGQEDIVIGSPIAGREHADLEDQIGFYVNTLALRTQFRGSDSFRALLKRVRQVTLDGYAHQVYQFDQLVEDLALRRDMSRSPLFDLSIVLHNTRFKNEPLTSGPGDLDIRYFPRTAHQVSKFDLTFNFHERGSSVLMSLEYNRDIFDASTIERLGAHVEQLLDALTQSADGPIGSVAYLKESEQDQLLRVFNGPQVSYPLDKTIVTLFEEQARRTPDAVAVVFEDTRLTYRELDEQSNQLAHHLVKSHGVGADKLAGILLHRSTQMIVSLLGILKAGGAYVPLDPTLPPGRISYLLEDTALSALITESAFDEVLIDSPVARVLMDDESSPWREEFSNALDTHIGQEDLAYVIYTSGSTGRPKGVMIRHQSLVDYYYGLLRHTNVGDCRSFGLFSTLAADLGNTVIYPSLLLGGRLHIYSGEEFLHDSDSERVDCIKIVPSHWKNLQGPGGLYIPAKTLIFGGEVLSGEVIGLLRDAGAACQVYNHYGPTETTIGKLLYRVDMTRDFARVPLGSPFCKSEVYVLDSSDQLTPIGVRGEICISGDGLARGYLNGAEQTKEKFVANPFKAGERMYRTGDIGRWLADGSIEYIGRKDDQVKIRGYRIELGEIQNILQSHTLVSSAVVQTQAEPNGDRVLVAYVVGSDGGAEFLDQLRGYLQDRLPGYMVPQYFVALERLPLTPNGKVDRKQLPAVELGSQRQTAYVAARDEYELKLVGLWQEVLGKERIGIKDNFFELGGHSLKAMRLSAQIHKTLEVRLPLKDLFLLPTIEQQAACLRELSHTGYDRIEPAVMQSHYPLSSSQKRLWLLSQLAAGSQAYHMPGAYVLEGSLDIGLLEWSFCRMICRHEILRTVFEEDAAGDPVQVIKGEDFSELFTLEVDGTGFDEDQLLAEVEGDMSRSFDLSRGPLLRARVYRLGRDKWLLSYTMHHIISDGWSMGVLIKELFNYYNGARMGAAYEPEALRIHYKDYAVWQQAQLSAGIAGHKAYWLNQFDPLPPVLNFPTDKTRPAIKNHSGDVVHQTIDAEITKNLSALCKPVGATLFMGVLATVNALLYRYTRQEDIVIGSPIAGREHADLEDQIGFYLNTLPLRTRFKGQDSFLQLIEKVKKITLEAYEHQLYPFDELVEALDVRGDSSRNVLFDCLVDFQNDNRRHSWDQGLHEIKISGYSKNTKPASKFDLLFDFVEKGEVLQLMVTYSTSLFHQATIKDLLVRYMALLRHVVQDPSQTLLQLCSRLDAMDAEMRNETRLIAKRRNLLSLKKKTGE